MSKLSIHRDGTTKHGFAKNPVGFVVDLVDREVNLFFPDPEPIGSGRITRRDLENVRLKLEERIIKSSS